MRESVQVAAATVMGALLGGLVGYLFFTDPGRRVRADLEPRLDDLTRDLVRVRVALEKTARAANEGRRLLDEMAGGIDREPATEVEQTMPF